MLLSSVIVLVLLCCGVTHQVVLLSPALLVSVVISMANSEFSRGLKAVGCSVLKT